MIRQTGRKWNLLKTFFGKEETMERFYKMVEASNKRFPEGVKPYQMATRLLEECGEIASEINLLEDSGIKRQRRSQERGYCQ